MLAPEINDVENDITAAFNDTLALDKNAKSCRTLMIGKVADDPDWLASVRSQVGILSDAGASWMENKPDIWAPILIQFINYSKSFAALAEQYKTGIADDQWVPLLQKVLCPLDDIIKKTRDAATALKTQEFQFRDVQGLLEASINAGWRELASEEQQMVAIATAMTQLQGTVDSLESEITSTTIRSGKSVISSSVSTIYKLLSTTGSTVSFLTIASSAYTVGKMFYDTVADTNKINEALEEIAKLQVEASHAAQAAAATKMVLQVLDRLKLAFASMNNRIPTIGTLWETERQKVKTTIEALQAGAKPSTFTELYTIPTANANWQSIAGFVNYLIDAPLTIGKAVTLDPSKSLPSST